MGTERRRKEDQSVTSRWRNTPRGLTLSVGFACVIGLLSACGGDSDAGKRRAALGDSGTQYTPVSTGEPEYKEPAAESETAPPNVTNSVATGTPVPTTALPTRMRSAGTARGARCFIYRNGQLLHATRRPGARLDWRRARYTLTMNWCVANGKFTYIKPDPGSARYDGLSAPGYKWGKSRLRTARYSDGSREYLVSPRFYFCLGGNVGGLDLSACRKYWQATLSVRPRPRSDGSLIWGYRTHPWVRATGANNIQLYRCYLGSLSDNC